MKKIITALILISILFCGCDHSPTGNSNTPTVSPTNTVHTDTFITDTGTDVSDIVTGYLFEGRILFGMKKNDVFRFMEEENFALYPISDDDPDSSYAEDGAVISSYGPFYYVTQQHYSFEIDESGSLIGLNIADENYTTEAGLRVGDTLKDMERIYGTNYVVKRNDYNDEYYQYEFFETYLMVGIQFDKIYNIRFSKFERW